MTAIDVVKADAKDVSETISSRVRDLAISMVAFAWTLLSPKDGEIQPIHDGHDVRRYVLIALAIAVTAIAFDVLKYVFRLAHLDRGIRYAQDHGMDEVRHEKFELFGVASTLFFSMNLLLVFAAAIVLVWSVLELVLSPTGK